MQRPGRPGLRGADSDATVTPGRRPCRRGVQAGRAGIRPGGAVRTGWSRRIALPIAGPGRLSAGTAAPGPVDVT